MFYPSSHYVFICDDCNVTYRLNNPTQARKLGWAISKDYKKCYCPVCALRHRNVGRNGVRRCKP